MSKIKNLIMMQNLGMPVPRFTNLKINLEFTVNKLHSMGVYDMISIRSSPDSSMPGILKTVLNISLDDKKAVEESYNIVYDSFYTKIASIYRKRFNLEEPLHPEIIFQEMVDGLGEDSGAGIFYTKDPDMLNNKNGSLCVYKENTTGFMVVDGKHAGDDFRSMHLKAYSQLVAYGKELEYRNGHPQDIEFVLDSGKLWLLQTRDVVLNDVDDTLSVKEGEQIEEFLPINPGAGLGMVSRTGIDEDFILFSEHLNVNESITFDNCKGIISLTGNKLCHAAILSRKYKIPCIVGDASKFLTTMVAIDGASGKVYGPDKIVIG